MHTKRNIVKKEVKELYIDVKLLLIDWYKWAEMD